MIINKKLIFKKALPIFIGAVAGFAYYYFIGCNNGSCVIQSNPYISTLYGAAVGGVFALPKSKKEKKNVE